MSEKERNLKILRRLIDNLKSEISREREYFLNNTREIDFEEFNKKVVKINRALFEFMKVLEILIDGLSREIKRLNIEKEKNE